MNVGVCMLERSDWDSKDSALGGRITCRLRDPDVHRRAGRTETQKNENAIEETDLRPV